MNSPINLLSIQEVIQSSIQNFSDRQKFVTQGRHSTIRRLSHFFLNLNDTKIERPHSIRKKFSMGVSANKKNCINGLYFMIFRCKKKLLKAKSQKKEIRIK